MSPCDDVAAGLSSQSEANVFLSYGENESKALIKTCFIAKCQ